MTIHILLIILQFLFSLIQDNDIINKEIILVYIGSSECRICNSEENNDSVSLVIYKLNNKLENMELITAGVSIDPSVEKGYNFLNKVYGDFNSVIIGEKPHNLGYNRYIEGRYKGKMLIPQVLILSRTYVTNSKEVRALEDEKLLYRLVGLNKIHDFIDLIDKINFNSFDK